MSNSMVHDPSADMLPRDVTFRVKAGSRKKLILTLNDSCNDAVAMCCCVVYNKGTWKVEKPDGTCIFNGPITYCCRAAGIVSYTMAACDVVAACSGVWMGEIEFKNACCVITDHSQTFGFVIEKGL